ncbi:MAG: ubiquinone/menaquinone biosynthesis C-methylase UbiE [Halieaceae bacterium]|jgi:ubiquinone/menaquinone biosynthesis C-methylase UbiE
MTIEAEKHWSGYWHQGHLTSLPCGFASNYDGEFLRFWNEQFAELNKGETVLDVCSGNGSIALLAQKYSHTMDLGLHVEAVDAADIDLSYVLKKQAKLARHIQSIKFIPNTLLEDMAGESESVGLVMSQFGVEYTNWEASASNIFRVMKPGGRLSLVCHSCDSTIMKQMESQCAEYAQLLGVDIFSQDFESKNREDFSSKFAGELNAALNAIYGIFKQRPSKLLSDVGSRLEEIHKLTLENFDAGLPAFLNFKQGLEISHQISEDLLAVNYAMRNSPRWYEAFSEAGLDLVRTGDIHYQTGEMAGIFYEFNKAI